MLSGRDLTIRETAQSYRVSLRTLRFYEERGLLTPSRIGQSRYYSEREQMRLQVILRAKLMGHSLAQIARMIDREEVPLEQPLALTEVLTRSQIEARLAKLVHRRQMTEAAIEALRAALHAKQIAEPTQAADPTRTQAGRGIDAADHVPEGG